MLKNHMCFQNQSRLGPDKTSALPTILYLQPSFAVYAILGINMRQRDQTFTDEKKIIKLF